MDRGPPQHGRSIVRKNNIHCTIGLFLFFILLLKWQNKLPYRREIQKCYYVQYALFDQLCLDGVREGWRGGVVLEGEKEREGEGEGEGGWEV